MLPVKINVFAAGGGSVEKPVTAREEAVRGV
jgi:hypothetical protein